MDIEEIRSKLYEDFDAQGIVERREKQKEAMLKEQQSQPQPIQPVDIYQRDMVNIRDYNNRQYPKGSSAIVSTAIRAVIDGMGAEGLIKAYNRAKEDINAFKANGERGRVNLRRKQYMEEYFLPAVELVVNSTSPDEVLNSKSALDELDKYALLEGSGKGYTATYIRQAYGDQLGQVEGRSDDSVRSGVRRINMLLDNGEIRTAFGIANKLKEQIDRGEHIADDVDYEMIGRIVAYYS